MKLDDRVAIVTGGGLGIGRHYCLGLAAAGAAVVVADIDVEAAAGVAAEVQAAGGRALGVRVDVANPDSVDQMVAETVARFGRIDILVNNAALYTALGLKEWHRIPLDEWDRVMAVNVKGLFLCSRAVHPHMKAGGGGRIINISSGTAFSASPLLLHYVTSKAGVIGFTRALAREVGADGITVNAIAPGLTRTGRQEDLDEAYFESRAVGRCIRRTQIPEDLVGTVLFLASDAAAFMTGQTLVVDGGRVMH